MTATHCADLAVSLSARASGEQGGPDAALLDEHLAACAHCRAELEATSALLGLARLPEVAPAERKALAGLPWNALAELRRDRVGTPIWRAFAVGFAAAAAIAVVIAAPTQVPEHFTAPASTARWQAPDADELTAAVDGSADEDGEGSDALTPAEKAADLALADLSDEAE
jgi:predicted anti-sigma-YlaC factor YlaD